MIDRVDGDADQSAHHGAVDANILQIATDGIFESAGNGARIPAAHRFRHERDNTVALGGDQRGGGSAGKAVDGDTDPRILLQARSHLTQRFAELPGRDRMRVARSA